jgi:hypothetical protein
MTSSGIEPSIFRLVAFVPTSSQKFAKESKDLIPFRSSYITDSNTVLLMVKTYVAYVTLNSQNYGHLFKLSITTFDPAIISILKLSRPSAT